MEKSLDSPITALVSDRYGHQLAVTTANGKITFFSTKDLTQLNSIEIKDGTPNCLSFSSDEFGSQLAVGLSNGTVVVISKNNQQTPINVHHAAITGVAFHPTQNVLATCSLDGTFAVHTFSENKWISTVTQSSKMGSTGIAWGTDSADPNVIQTIFVGNADGTVAVYLSSPGSNSWEVGPIAQVQNGWVRQVVAPSASNTRYQKVATFGDDDTANIVKFTDKLVILSTGTLPVPPTGVAWAMVDQTLVVSHSDGSTTLWKEDQDGNLVQMNQ